MFAEHLLCARHWRGAGDGILPLPGEALSGSREGCIDRPVVGASDHGGERRGRSPAQAGGWGAVMLDQVSEF